MSIEGWYRNAGKGDRIEVRRNANLPDREAIKRRKPLRKTLIALGFTLVPLNEPVDQGRELVDEKLKPVASVLNKAVETTQTEKKSEVTSSAHEILESMRGSENFLDRVNGYRSWWQLPSGHYQFVDTGTGAPVGAPVPPQDFIVDKNNKLKLVDSEFAPNAYRLTSAEPAWREFVKHDLATKWGFDTSSLTQLNVNADFSAALKNNAEPELQAGIKAGAIETNLDIVGYFGMNPDRTVPGDSENRTYAQYVLDEMPKQLDIPDSVVKEEIMKHILGLIAKESKFNDGMNKNFATAWGAFQLTDDVREEHLFSYNDNLTPEENERLRHEAINRKLTFQEQVDIAGKHFSNIFKRLPHWIAHGYEKVDGKWQTTDRAVNLEVLKSLYASEDDWKRHGLIPWMIGAYNGGSLLMGDAIDKYLKHHGSSIHDKWQNVTGYDLYYTISQYAYHSEEGRLVNYGDDSVQYVPMTFAATAEIAREFPELTSSSQIATAE